MCVGARVRAYKATRSLALILASVYALVNDLTWVSVHSVGALSLSLSAQVCALYHQSPAIHSLRT